MKRPLMSTSTYRERVVTARKDHACDNYPRCEHGGIKAGDRYMICTEYPGGDSGYADSAGRPVRLVLCEPDSMRDFPGGPVSAGGEDR